MGDLLVKLQRVDRRWIYLAVAIACTVPFLVKITLPVYPTGETRTVFECVENIPRDKDGRPTKVVIIDSGWDAGSMAESMGQAEAMVDHLFRLDIPFVVIDLAGSDKAPQFMVEVTERFTKDKKDKYGKMQRAKYPDKKYGRDWVIMGYSMIGGWQAIQVLTKDFHRLYPRDFVLDAKMNDAEKLPLMQRVRDINDIYMIMIITYSPNEEYVSWVHGIYGTPITFGCAGIQSTVTYRFLPSNQLEGMLVGIRGGAEYDVLLYPDDVSKRRNFGTQLIVPLAFGHLVIIAAVIIGNLGYFIERSRRRRR